MHQFFVTPMQVKEDHIYIEGLDVNHIKNVLRMKVGEALKVNDGTTGLCPDCRRTAGGYRVTVKNISFSGTSEKR